jgi:hypothetical protein
MGEGTSLWHLPPGAGPAEALLPSLLICADLR